MLLVVGSYEQMLLGYSLVHDSQSDSRIEAKASFTDHSHNGYVKTLASSKNVLASGSTDERIWLVNYRYMYFCKIGRSVYLILFQMKRWEFCAATRELFQG